MSVRKLANVALEKKLPFAGEFSPGQVDLRRLLEIVSASDTDGAFVEAVRSEYFSASCAEYQGEARIKQQSIRAGNVLKGMRQYGIVARGDFALTAVGQELAELASDEDAMYRFFAAHIITKVRGSDVLSAVDNLLAKGERPTKENLSIQMRDMGFTVTTASTYHQTLLNWLKKAKLFIADSEYRVDPAELAKILGTEPTILTDIQRLSRPEQLFLKALANSTTEAGQRIRVKVVMEYAKNLYQLKVREDQWRAKLLEPLSQAGWFTLERATAGRGGKSGDLIVGEKLTSKFIKPLLEQEVSDIPPSLREGLFRPLAQILQEVRSEDKNIKGRALEHLAARITQLIDLKPKVLRLRSAQTGGAEVDLVAESSRLMFSRWQVQCKNKPQLSMEDVAKEVGIAIVLRSQVILMVTTGKVSAVVNQYSRQINETTSMQVIVLDGSDLRRIADDPSSAGLALTEILTERAGQVMQQKAAQISVVD
ncbi:MAG: restriction endonuclease [Acidobacteriaceae bacterium]